MADNTNRVRGLRDVQQALKKLPDKVEQRVLDDAVRAGAQVILKEAKARVRVRSGALKRSIALGALAAGQRRRPGQIFVGVKEPESERAHLLEFGTRYARAFPFLRPAVDTRRRAFIKKVADMLGKGVEREATKLGRGRRR